MPNYTAREIQEMQFARVYKDKFAHGTPGHGDLILIAKLAEEVASLRYIVECLNRSEHPLQYHTDAMDKDLKEDK